ncbi:uncharacterized protein LOC130285056 isoform X2 [Hyla sarda]|nr:uncharacterized protein LOC130285056 isoform X2 [Hyla sarda]
MIHGVHSTLYLELCQHPDKFASYLRMTVENFDDLLQRIQDRICRQDTHLRQSISPDESLIVTLSFLASGESFSSLHLQFRLGISISGIVRTTCEAEYYNYKKFFSTILMGIADAQYRFITVDMGSYGRTNDSRVFKTSAMGRRIYSGKMGLPETRAFPGTDGPPMPFVFVGDKAFQMCCQLAEALLQPRTQLQTVSCQTLCGVCLWNFCGQMVDLHTANPTAPGRG